MTEVGDRIRVMAAFGKPYKIKPLKFSWSERVFDIKEVTYQWKSKEGQAEILHFCVSDGCNVFEISFNLQTLIWRLEKVQA